jgi:membrane-associated phospholipid phosphatase
MDETDGGHRSRIGVLAGARQHTLPRLIGLVLAAFVAVEALLLGLGLLVTRALDDSALNREELDFERTLEAQRTPFWDQMTHYGSVLGSTITVIALTAAGCLLLAWRGQGPRLPAFLAVAVAGETGLFLLAALVIDRRRPPVEHLDIAPPTSSFPSGHTGAATALYVGLALVLTWHVRRTALRVLVLAAFLALPVLVGVARMYRGMHHPTDVLFGILNGAACLTVAARVILLRGGAG